MHHTELATLTPEAARIRIRQTGDLATTSGVSLGYAQANIAIVPERVAGDFNRFCTLNAKACPLLHVSEPGDYRAPQLGHNLDIRTDVPGYIVLEHGETNGEVRDISSHWQDDFVTFYIGCSFSFEEALLSQGIDLPHIKAGRNVAMYKTNLPMHNSGPFSGNMVVSMRMLTPEEAIRAIQITADMPMVHGAPVHIGNPQDIGIDNLDQPDFGDPPPPAPGHIPVFWACGVSSQIALASARLPLSLTHAPGKMLITDVPNWRLRF
jgi:uncharacterized protein YcsI (UPF0317 family)